MLNKLGQAYQQKFFRTEQLSPPLKRFQVYPQTLDEIDQKNEIFLDFKTPKEELYGVRFSTDMLVVSITLCIGLLGIIFSHHLVLIEKLISVAAFFGIVLLIVGLPSILEILKPLPTPWRFNRRTREVYAFDESGQLYHAPWDNIQAHLSTGTVFIPKSGPMSTAVLEVQLHRFGDPSQKLNIALGMTLGGQRYQKLRLWEYLCTYMDQGPGFETLDMASAAGKPISEPDSELYNPHAPALSPEEQKQATQAVLNSPVVRFLLWWEKHDVMTRMEQWAYRRALRRPRKHTWPELVLERCRPDGPTTRLVDIEMLPEARKSEETSEAPVEPAPEIPAPESTEARIAAHRERIRAARAAKIQSRKSFKTAPADGEC